MVQLGMANSRMKDFCDVAVLARNFDFDGALLARVYWFGVNVTVLGESYRSRSMEKGGSCGRLVEFGAAKATHLAGGLKPGIARSPDSGATAGEAIGWSDVADRAV